MEMYANEFETRKNKNTLKQKINCNIYTIFYSERLFSTPTPHSKFDQSSSL